MNGVLPLVTAELLQLHLLRHRFLVLGRAVVPVLTLGALKSDDLSACARHFVLLGELNIEN
jgi:hypothetical protein